ncbi:MAG: permease-like cell division protein FtsX [Desulfobulbaceae bacterium]|nr:permease-like cell division protein FtsX [Desulfobulbaceae bacterium]
MNFLFAVFQQTTRNLFQTWGSQVFTLLTITLSVLIFSFFYLVYSNMLNVGKQLGDDLRLVVYLDEEPGPELQEEYRYKILKFDRVDRIEFISSKDAYQRFSTQLGEDKDVLADMPDTFLPPSIEVYPVRSLDTLSRIKRFSDYLMTLPGVLKVQYGREWVERFYTFIQLLRIVVILSGTLLVLTTTLMVAHTIRLSLLSRQDELELLRLVGASSHYMRTPFFLEGAMHGFFGSTGGLFALYVLYNWIQLHFTGSTVLPIFSFTFFPPVILMIIISFSVLLCASGSFISTNKFIRL